MTVINVICFILFAILSYVIIKEMNKNHMITGIKSYFKDRSDIRKDLEQNKVLEDGYGQNMGLLYRLDLVLYQSGISKNLPWMVSEIFFLMSVFMTTACFTAVLILSGKMLYALCTGILFVFIEYMTVTLLMAHNTKRIEEDIINFANLLDNYSKTSDDIVSIMENTWLYLGEPLRSSVRNCCAECRTSGDTVAAFKRLELSVRHPKFSELVRNLELCSRYNADYSSVIRKNRELIENYLAQKQIRKQMANNSRLNILILYAGAGVVIKLLEGIGENGIFKMLTGSLTGNIILIITFAVILYSAKKMLTLTK